jgi:hypothetical protein
MTDKEDEILKRLERIEDILKHLRSDLRVNDKNIQGTIHNLTTRLDQALQRGLADYNARR